MLKKISVLVFLMCCMLTAMGQSEPSKKDTVSKFDAFNKKAEALFKILPVPLYSYSTEAGNIYGLAKFNLFQLSKKDTVSKPSKLSEVVTVSTLGRVNASVSTELVFNENKYVIVSYFNYKRQPEYILGIGNDVSIDDVEEINFNRTKFSLVGLRLAAKNLYAGIALDLSRYFEITTDSNSFLIEDDVTGVNGGRDFGVGFSAAYDSRDNRYNARHGAYVLSTLVFYPEAIGTYPFAKFELDARKFITPWRKHVIALQATTSYASGDVPFYDLSLLGGEDKMRGYYKGALRDKVLVDMQVEYRIPIWKIFGATTWIGTGRVAPSYGDLSLDGFWLSYGAGLRVKVDSKHDTNLRLDFGFGPGGISAFYINFAEAF